MAYSVATDQKWQKIWEDTKLYQYNPEAPGEKLYCMEMFSYPSGSNLHLGHWYNYSLADSWVRFKKMQGYNVFHPMGFDAFGLPAENYAIKTGIHPQDSTYKNIKTMETQLKAMGATYDWDYEFATCDPEYYKWNQWMFLKLLEKDLAYRKKAPVNWCNSCQTVLANEQVIDGNCERCQNEVEKKQMTQWFFSITKYAQELLDGLANIDWPDKTKKIQTNWIGRSQGAQLAFQCYKDGQLLLDTESKDHVPLLLKVFTTRPDTFMGVTYVVVAPESPLCDLVTTTSYLASVKEYQAQTKKTTEIDRLSTTRDKTGVFTGSYAIHPLTQEKLPIWTSDYVIASYGTGVVMAVPAHDERDFEFATKFKLPIQRVIVKDSFEADLFQKGQQSEISALPFCEKGCLVNSEEFSGLDSATGSKKIIDRLTPLQQGEFTINYRLRDWLISRQRYWGTPIPIVHCKDCGVVPVPYDQLPVVLPYDVEFTPDGESPLKKAESFMETPCPKCNKMASREADTMDTFVDSSWYQLRYLDPNNSQQAFNTDLANKMCPVDMYVGGSEHAAMHLLYTRFICKAFRDMGLLHFDEPFKRLVHQGIILGPDGFKMSKSRGNVVAPDAYIQEFGSDVFRTYLAFGFAYIDGGPWNDNGLQAIAKFFNRIERIVEEVKLLKLKIPKSNKTVLFPLSQNFQISHPELKYSVHYAIKSVTQDLPRFQFNTSIARLMELLNSLQKYLSVFQSTPNFNLPFGLDLVYTTEILLTLLAPFAPHFTEELWEALGNDYSIFQRAWPQFDPTALVLDQVEIAVQINGQVKFKVMVSSNSNTEEVKDIITQDERFASFLNQREVKKFIYIPGRLANIVAK